MKICFINPAPRSYIIERGHEKTGSYPPLGTLYIMGYLKREAYDSVLIDQHATKIPTSRVLELVKNLDPDIIGFNSLTDINMGMRSIYIAKLVKKWNPNVTIVFGNCHATFNHDKILKKYPHVDICVRGEGELTFHDLVKTIENGRDLANVRGITYREKEKIKINQDRPLIENLDELPFPDRKACDEIEYRQNYGGFNADYGKFTTIQSSRGCTFNCTFCCQSKLSKRKWRTRSIQHVIDELELLQNEGYTSLYWVDDNFTNSPKRSMNLFREMQKRHFDFVWVCDQRVDLVSSKLMTEMRKAGCRTMALGIESANQRILDFFNKKITPDMSIKATKTVKKAGIDFVMGTFVIGAPTETLKEIKNTLSFARKLDIDFPQFHIFGAIPGTEIWDKLVQEGKINPDKYWENGVKTLVPPLDIVQEEMRKAYLNFLLRPKYILSQVLRTLKSMHRWKIIFSNLDSFSSYRTMRNFYEFTTEMWTHGVEGE